HLRPSANHHWQFLSRAYVGGTCYRNSKNVQCPAMSAGTALPIPASKLSAEKFPCSQNSAPPQDTESPRELGPHTASIQKQMQTPLQTPPGCAASFHTVQSLVRIQCLNFQ